MNEVHQLKAKLAQWEEWAASADKGTDGWESDFPQWEELIDLASQVMQKGTLSKEELEALERCWSISSEGEELSDFAMKNLNDCWNAIEALVSSEDPNVRWQVYKVLGDPDLSNSRGEKLLRKGLDDIDSYSRRRAIISLSKYKPKDAWELAKTFINSDDPYIRQASIEMILATGDQEFIRQSYDILKLDEIDHVREEAERLLSRS